MLRAVADDPVLAQAEIAVAHRAARAGEPVDVDSRLRRAEQLEAVDEARRRIPERRRSAVRLEEPRGGGLALGDDRRGESRRDVVRERDGFVETVDELE